MIELKAGPELNALVAEEIMGWMRVSHYNFDAWRWFLCHPDTVKLLLRNDCRLGSSDSVAEERWQRGAPDYSTDINRARQVEDEIDELGLRDEYILALTRALFVPVRLGDVVYENVAGGYYELHSDLLWNMVHATSEQRCIAAVMAKRGNT